MPTVRAASSLRSPLVLVCAAAMALSGYSVVQANSRPAVIQAAPTAIGFIDLQALVEGLEEVRDQNKELEKRAKELQAQINAVKTEFEAAKAAFEACLPNDPRKFELGVKAKALELQFNGQQQGLKAVLGIEKGRYWKLLYKRINTSVAQLAAQQGLDAILLDDRKMELPMDKELTDDQITGFLQNKKVLFATAKVDVTGALVDLMNNSFAANGKK